MDLLQIHAHFMGKKPSSGSAEPIEGSIVIVRRQVTTKCLETWQDNTIDN